MNKAGSIFFGLALFVVVGVFLYREQRAEERIRQLTRLVETQRAEGVPTGSSAPPPEEKPDWKVAWERGAPSPDPSALAEDPDGARIDALLARAEDQLARNHLMAPTGANAYETNRALAALVGEDDDRVRHGLVAIRDRYLDLARYKVKRREFAAAHEMVNRALTVTPEDPVALGVRIEIDRADEAARARALVRKARAQLAANHLGRPPGDNALETFRALAAVVGDDDGRVVAGFEAIKNRYLTLARAKMRIKDFETAQSYVDLALAAVPGDAEAKILREHVHGVERTDVAIANRRSAEPLWEPDADAAPIAAPDSSKGPSDGADPSRGGTTAGAMATTVPSGSADLALPFLRTLTRPPDAVIVKGRSLDTFIGHRLDGLGLYALSEGRWTPIPFQIDEMVDEDRYVFEGGKRRDGIRGTGALKADDELAFMADDCGAEGWDLPMPEGAIAGVEIVLADPLDGGRGWVYLFEFASDDFPRSSRDYVSYDPEREVVVADGYTIAYEAGEDHIYFEHLKIPPAMGANGVDFMDRLKLRTYVKTIFLFSLTFDEEDWESHVTQYIDGPVRVIRQVENELNFMGFTVAPTVRTNAKYYRLWHEAPSVIKQTVNIPAIAREAWFKLSVDLNPNAKGMRYYRPTTDSSSPWHAIDGRMTEDEARIDRETPRWHLVTGDPGTLLWRVELPKELRDASKMIYVDDARADDGPESTRGAIGETGFRLDLFPLVQDHSYFVNLYYMTPPHWRPGQERYYLNMVDQPIAVTISARPLFARQESAPLTRAR